MPAIFVSGVPETAAIWDRLRGRLSRETTALSLPGFGCPRPAGFSATMDEYADWLLGELDSVGEPVDLVGHDWGGILTTRMATTVPDRLRSWASDAVTIVDPDFTWHDFAKIWQTPGEGEAFWNGLREAPADAIALLSSLGVPEDDAAAMVTALDETMISCILDLYRSADDIGRRWGGAAPTGAPGLVLVGAADAFGDEARSRATAERLGAQVSVIPGAGHWWPLESADAGAEALEAFWATLP